MEVLQLFINVNLDIRCAWRIQFPAICAILIGSIANQQNHISLLDKLTLMARATVRSHKVADHAEAEQLYAAGAELVFQRFTDDCEFTAVVMRDGKVIQEVKTDELPRRPFRDHT